MILSIERSRRRWPKVVIGAAALAVVAYVFHEAGAQGVEPVPPQVVSVPMPVVAPPGPNAEPELQPMNQLVKAPAAQLTLPATVPVAVEEPPPEQEVPRPIPEVTAMMKKTYACRLARVGGAEEAIARIVARDGTITAAQMDGLRRFEARCLGE